MGRRLDDGAPLTGGTELSDVDLAARRDGRWVIAEEAHARRTHPSTNGGRRLFRKGANYELVGAGRESETGLIFQSFQRNLTGQFVPIQQMMDAADALNEWTTAVGSAEFAILPGFAEGEWLGHQLLAEPGAGVVLVRPGQHGGMDDNLPPTALDPRTSHGCRSGSGSWVR